MSTTVWITCEIAERTSGGGKTCNPNSESHVIIVHITSIAYLSIELWIPWDDFLEL